MDEKNQLECLVQASSILHSSIELEDLLKKMLSLISDVLECEKGFIYILDESKGVPVLVEDTRKDPRWKTPEGPEGLSSVLCVPMHFNDSLLGVIEVVNKKNGKTFDYEDLRFFQGFANISGAAIINARKFMDFEKENRGLKKQATAAPEDLIGNSKAIQRIIGIIQKIAKSDSIVLITGGSGTGKEVIAGNIHQLSHRKDKPFMPLNCGALPETLLESELFGHEKGAFTGADRARAGIFEEASGGTIFLDEIGETSLSTQVKLLRVLQENKIKRIGSNWEIHVDVRVISATNRNLEDLIGEKRFREDLYYRLNVVGIIVPPLSERTDDIPVLAEYFLKKSCKKMKKNLIGISPNAMRVFFTHKWRGNIRELENAIESAAAMTDGPYIEPADLPAAFQQDGAAATSLISLSNLTFEDAKDEFERQYFTGLLNFVGGNTKEAAKRSQVSKKSIIRRKKRFGIS